MEHFEIEKQLKITELSKSIRGFTWFAFCVSSIRTCSNIIY